MNSTQEIYRNALIDVANHIVSEKMPDHEIIVSMRDVGGFESLRDWEKQCRMMAWVAQHCGKTLRFELFENDKDPNCRHSYAKVFVENRP